MSADPIARGLALRTRLDVLGSDARQKLARAIRTNGGFPRPTASLAAGDVPVLTVGAAGGVSAINGAAVHNPLVARTDARLTYVSGPPMARGTGYPQGYYFTARGGYYGSNGTGGEARAGAYFAYEFLHTGSQFEVPIYASGNTGTNFRVLVNGAVGAVAAVPASGGGLYYVKATFPAAGTRRIRIETAGIPAGGINVVASGEIAATERTYPLATLIGDSFVEGSGSEVGDIAATVTARALGFAVAQAGVGGTGLINAGTTNWNGQPKVAWHHAERVRDLTLAGVTSAQDGSAADPVIGLVFGSLNDQGLAAGVWGAYGATLSAALANRAETLIDAWVAARPGKPLVLLGPTWPSGPPSNRPPLDLYRLRDGYAEAAWGRSSDNVWFIDRLRPQRREGVWSTATDQASLYTGSDGQHPTPAGHRFDGLADAAALRSLILSEMR